MTLAEARAVARNGTTSYSQYQEACAVIYGEHMKRAHPGTRFVMDARARPYLRDQPEPLPGNPEVTGGGSAPGGAVGSRLVTRLPGPATSYFIATDPETGEAALYCTCDPDGAMDPGKISTGAGFIGDAHRQAKVIRTQDYARQRDELRRLNEQNRKAWG